MENKRRTKLPSLDSDDNPWFPPLPGQEIIPGTAPDNDISKTPEGGNSGGAEGGINETPDKTIKPRVPKIPEKVIIKEIKQDYYNPTKEELEEGLYTTGNMEILIVQKMAMKRLGLMRAEAGARRGTTIKEIVRDAIDKHLREEFKKL
jgi:hypothetical protein